MLDREGDYYLCFECDQKLSRRQQSQKKEIEKSQGLVIDRVELVGLKTEGLLSMRSYVYLALRLDGIEKQLHKINTRSFCQKWGVSKTDYLIAIASLNKKGVIDMKLPDISARAYSHQEKMEILERGLNE